LPEHAFIALGLPAGYKEGFLTTVLLGDRCSPAGSPQTCSSSEAKERKTLPREPPAKAGVHILFIPAWMPAFAGMTYWIGQFEQYYIVVIRRNTYYNIATFGGTMKAPAYG